MIHISSRMCLICQCLETRKGERWDMYIVLFPRVIPLKVYTNFHPPRKHSANARKKQISCFKYESAMKNSQIYMYHSTQRKYEHACLVSYYAERNGRNDISHHSQRQQEQTSWPTKAAPYLQQNSNKMVRFLGWGSEKTVTVFWSKTSSISRKFLLYIFN